MREVDRLVRDVKTDSLFWGLSYWMKVVTRAVGPGGSLITASKLLIINFKVLRYFKIYVKEYNLTSFS